MNAIKAGDLNTSHLGKVVTVTRDETTVTGILTSIKHIADLIDDRRQFDVLPRFVLGHAAATVDIMHAGRIELDSNSEVAVGE